MPTIQASIEVEIWCSCGEGLCNKSDITTRNSHYCGEKHSITVEPCQKCLDKARDDGYDEGAASEKVHQEYLGNKS